MNENPYTPPESEISPAEMLPGQTARPWQVVMALVLASVGRVMDFSWLIATQGTYSVVFAPETLAGLAIIVWLYYKIYLGRNWARIATLLMTLGGILVNFAFYPPQSLAALETTKMVVWTALGIGTLWLLFISPGREWFRRRADKR